MLDRSGNEKTFKELINIFNESSIKMTASEDLSNDFRIFDFVNDMGSGKWRGPVPLKVDEGMRVIDGIHRGIAYLKCVEKGIDKESLPIIQMVHSRVP